MRDDLAERYRTTVKTFFSGAIIAGVGHVVSALVAERGTPRFAQR